MHLLDCKAGPILPPMRTRKLFWQDPYCAQANRAVSSVSGADIFLASAIFFAFSGGQEGDRGTIGGFEVLEAKKDRLDIRYTLQQGHSIRQGEVVTARLDRDRRYPQAPKIGAHISQDKARIDFALSRSTAPLLPSVADEANAIVSADLPIVAGFDDEESERRYCLAEGLSPVPCGGTHVRRTGELGRVSLKTKRWERQGAGGDFSDRKLGPPRLTANDQGQIVNLTLPLS